MGFEYEDEGAGSTDFELARNQARLASEFAAAVLNLKSAGLPWKIKDGFLEIPNASSNDPVPEEVFSHSPSGVPYNRFGQPMVPAGPPAGWPPVPCPASQAVDKGVPSQAVGKGPKKKEDDAS